MVNLGRKWMGITLDKDMKIQRELCRWGGKKARESVKSGCQGQGTGPEKQQEREWRGERDGGGG